MLGGREPQSLDLWEWNPVTGAWVDRTPNPLPVGWIAAHSGNTLVYDVGRRTAVLCGGQVGALPERGLWECDGR